MKQAARRKSTTRVVQKGEVITVGKARQDIRMENSVDCKSGIDSGAESCPVVPWVYFLKGEKAF